MITWPGVVKGASSLQLVEFVTHMTHETDSTNQPKEKMMKKFLIAVSISALMLSGCATTMYTSTGQRCDPHGLVNTQDQCPDAKYEVRPGNAILGVLAFPAFPLGTAISAYVLGWNLYGPVQEKK